MMMADRPGAAPEALIFLSAGFAGLLSAAGAVASRFGALARGFAVSSTTVLIAFTGASGAFSWTSTLTRTGVGRSTGSPVSAGGGGARGGGAGSASAPSYG